MTSTTMRVLVTGSRTWKHPDAIWSVLDAVAANFAAEGSTNMVVVHGAAYDGADKFADQWVLRAPKPDGLEVRAERHPANWAKHHNRAGMIRNQEMADAGGDICFAFLSVCTRANCRIRKPHHSHGASHCADAAEANGIPVRRYEESEVTS